MATSRDPKHRVQRSVCVAVVAALLMAIALTGPVAGQDSGNTTTSAADNTTMTSQDDAAPDNSTATDPSGETATQNGTDTTQNGTDSVGGVDVPDGNVTNGNANETVTQSPVPPDTPVTGQNDTDSTQNGTITESPSTGQNDTDLAQNGTVPEPPTTGQNDTDSTQNGTVTESPSAGQNDTDSAQNGTAGYDTNVTDSSPAENYTIPGSNVTENVTDSTGTAGYDTNVTDSSPAENYTIPGSNVTENVTDSTADQNGTVTGNNGTGTENGTDAGLGTDPNQNGTVANNNGTEVENGTDTGLGTDPNQNGTATGNNGTSTENGTDAGLGTDPNQNGTVAGNNGTEVENGTDTGMGGDVNTTAAPVDHGSNTTSGADNDTEAGTTPPGRATCQNDTCGDHGVCNGTECVCDEGWSGENCTDDVDECSLGVCQNAQYCENRLGSYMCHCSGGWTGANCSEDVDECSTPESACPDANAICSNNNGSFDCVCKDGFERLAPGATCTEDVLLPYNTSYTRRESGDDEMFGPFPIPYGFQLNRQTMLAYYVSINGYITFNTPFSSPTMPDVSSPQLSPLPFLAPYWADIHIPQGTATSGLYHVTLSLEETLEDDGKRALFLKYKAAFPSEFSPVYLAVFTWLDVKPYKAEDFVNMQGATFQIVLATDGQTLRARLAWRSVWPSSDHLKVKAVTHLTSDAMQDLMPLTAMPHKVTITSSSTQQTSGAALCIDWLHTQGTQLPRGPPRVACPCSLQQASHDAVFQVNMTSRCATSKVFDVTGMKQVCCYSADDMINTNPITSPLPLLQSTNQSQAVGDGHSACCWSSNPVLCAKFRELFPVDTCSGYTAPSAALLWGDPHLVTLDGDQYTFNGWGEYVVLTPPDSATSSALHVQGRTDKLSDANVTVFKAFAVKYNDTVLQAHHSAANKLTLYVSGEEQTGGSALDTVHGWDGVHVTLMDSDSVLDIVLPSSVVLKITATADRLSLSLSAPPDTLQQSRGLLGYVDGDVTNDFQLRNGTTLTASDRTPENFFVFGQSWLLENEEESIFHYNLSGTGDNFTSYQHPEFTPLLLPLTVEALLAALNETGMMEVAMEICDVSTACLQDLLATGNNDTARQTRSTLDTMLQASSVLSQKPPQFLQQPAVWNVTLTSSVFRHNIVTAAEESNDTLYPDVTVEVNSGGLDLNFTLSAQTSGTWELVWYLSDDVRNLTTLTFTFKAVSAVTNMTSYYKPDVVLCACAQNEECSYLVSSQALSTINGSGMFYMADCQCGATKGGRFCQDDVTACDACYDVSTCDTNVTEGSVCTKCPDGLQGDGIKCYEVDECREMSPCDQLCTNTVGSFNCTCRQGFSLMNATTCHDVNECIEDMSNCTATEFCQNTVGGFECVCRPGFGGYTCTETVSHVYGGQLLFLSLAENQQGWTPDLAHIHTAAFKQLADKVQHVISYLLSQENIQPITVTVVKFELVQVSRQRRSTDGGMDHMINATFQVGFGTPMNVTSLEAALTSGFDSACTSLCPFGPDHGNVTTTLYGVSRQRSSFEAAYDLCVSDRNNRCHDDSTVCRTQDGAAICHCRHGYQPWSLYDYACQDVNECLVNSTQQLCGLTGTDSTQCHNTVGSYYCTCPKSHRWDADRMRCSAVSGVCGGSSSPCLNGAECITTTDTLGYACRCPDGWTGLDCGDEDGEFQKMKTTLIVVGSVLGGLCLLLLVAVIAMCFVRSSSAKAVCINTPTSGRVTRM